MYAVPGFRFAEGVPISQQMLGCGSESLAVVLCVEARFTVTWHDPLVMRPGRYAEVAVAHPSSHVWAIWLPDCGGAGAPESSSSARGWMPLQLADIAVIPVASAARSVTAPTMFAEIQTVDRSQRSACPGKGARSIAFPRGMNEQLRASMQAEMFIRRLSWRGAEIAEVQLRSLTDDAPVAASAVRSARVAPRERRSVARNNDSRHAASCRLRPTRFLRSSPPSGW